MELLETSTPIIGQVESSIKQIDSLKRSIQYKQTYLKTEHQKPKTEAFLFTSEAETIKDIQTIKTQLIEAESQYLRHLRKLAGLVS